MKTFEGAGAPDGGGRGVSMFRKVLYFFSISFGYVLLRFLIVPIRTRLLTEWLSKELYARLNLAIVTITFAATILSLGSYLFLVRKLPGHPAGYQAGVFRMILRRLGLPMCVGVMVLIAVGGMLLPVGGGTAGMDGWLLAAAFGLSFLLLFGWYYYQGRAEMGHARVVQLFQNDLWFLGLLGLGAGGLASFTAVTGVWVAWLAVLLGWMLTGLWRPLRTAVEPPELRMREVLTFGLPLLPMIGSEAVFRMADRYLLMWMRDLETVADYTLCANIAFMVFVVGQSVLEAFMPRLFAHRNFDSSASEGYRPGAEVRTLFSVMLRYSLGLSLVAGACLFLLNKELLSVLSGPAFHSAAPLLPWLVATPLFFLLSTVAGRGLMAMDRTMLVGAANLGAALVTIGLNLALIPKFGARGAAVSSTAGFALLTVYLGGRLRWRLWMDWAALRGWRVLGAAVCSAAWFAALGRAGAWAGPITRLGLAGAGAAGLLLAWGVMRPGDARYVGKLKAAEAVPPAG